MARAASQDGTEILAATPHVREDYPTSADTVEGLVAALESELAAAGIPLEVRTGGEIALDRLAELPPEELARFGLAGNPRYLLVEFPYYGWPLDLAFRLGRLQASGVTPVLAHPERNFEVQEKPELLRPLVESGALVQLTAASLDGRIGRRSRATARALLELALAHLAASDAHAPDVRSIGLSSVASAVGDPELARWLVEGVPRAIVEDGALPARPAKPRRRFSRRR